MGFYGAQILMGLEKLHKKSIVYRDLKLGNVLLDNKGYCKLTDLGLAVKKIEDEDLTEYAGTPGYIAPEVVLQTPYDQTADYFSFGCVMFRLLTGARIFCGLDQDELDNSVVNEQPKFTDDNEDEFPMTEEAKDIILKLVEKDARKRLGANGIAEIKKHPWFADVSFENIMERMVEPEFVPDKDEIYAEAAADIELHKHDIHEEKVRQEMYDTLEPFPYYNPAVLQEEIVFSLEKVIQRRKVEGMDLTQTLFAFPDPAEERERAQSVLRDEEKGCADSCSIM